MGRIGRRRSGDGFSGRDSNSGNGADPVRRLRKLWDEHTHTLAPIVGPDPRQQEVALYASWIGSMVEAALRRGGLDRNRASMLAQRRDEGNERLFRAAGELGEPVRSYVARLIALEDLLAQLPVK